MSASFAHDFTSETPKKPLNEKTFDDNAKRFYCRAKIAYETIITTFSGNLKRCKGVLDKKVYDNLMRQ